MLQSTDLMRQFVKNDICSKIKVSCGILSKLSNAVIEGICCAIIEWIKICCGVPKTKSALDLNAAVIIPLHKYICHTMSLLFSGKIV